MPDNGAEPNTAPGNVSMKARVLALTKVRHMVKRFAAVKSLKREWLNGVGKGEATDCADDTD